MKRVRLDTSEIRDWESFHDVFHRTMGFPDYYGANMDAWIDCMGYVNHPESGMSQVFVEPGEMLVLEISWAEDFRKRCPDQFDALVDCAAIVNAERCSEPVLAFVFL